jgi:hypothetical protein
MSYVDTAFSNQAKDPIILDPGQYKLRIVKATYGDSKRGQKQFTICFKSAEFGNVQLVNDWLGIPDSSDDEDAIQRKSCRMRDFKVAFGAQDQWNVNDAPNDKGSFDVPELVGKEGWVMLEVRDSDNGKQNSIKRYLVGQ